MFGGLYCRTVDVLKIMNEPLPPSEDNVENPERRQFLSKAASFVFGGAVVTVPVGAGVATLLLPLGKKDSSKLKVMLANIEDLPADGTPKLYQVVAERKDAWTKYANKPIGSVFLRKTGDTEVVAFNSSCPHAGCSVDLNPNGEMFSCPCHESNFDMEGGIIGKSVSPRGLDELEIDEQLLSKGEVWVTFVNFKAGVTDKVEV